MSRPARYPQLQALQQPGDVALFRAHNFVPRIAKQYAARHGYQVSIETQDEPLAVRADLGTLYRVVRL